MTFTVEIPDDAKNVKVSVLCDGKPYSGKHCRYSDYRFSPGHWNGLNGGMHYGQYFDMEDVNRVQEMMEVASALSEYGIRYYLSKLKRNYRIMIAERDYKRMDETLRQRIIEINHSHDMTN